MSRIIVAAHASFCPGVRRAVTLLEQAAAHGGEGIYGLGEIIHNRQFNDSVRQKGVRILSEAELDALPADAHIFIRTHGVERQTYERLAAGGYACTDATCPYVRKIHEIVSSAGPDAAVVILGDETHPEVLNLLHVRFQVKLSQINIKFMSISLFCSNNSAGFCNNC